MNDFQKDTISVLRGCKTYAWNNNLEYVSIWQCQMEQKVRILRTKGKKRPLPSSWALFQKQQKSYLSSVFSIERIWKSTFDSCECCLQLFAPPHTFELLVGLYFLCLGGTMWLVLMNEWRVKEVCGTSGSKLTMVTSWSKVIIAQGESPDLSVLWPDNQWCPQWLHHQLTLEYEIEASSLLTYDEHLHKNKPSLF